MNRFSVIYKEKYQGKATLYPREFVSEETAINKALHIFRFGTMQQVVVVDEAMHVVYKQMRKCHCTNVQQCFLSPRNLLVYQCVDCALVIDYNGWKVGADAPVVEEAPVVERPAEIVETVGVGVGG